MLDATTAETPKVPTRTQVLAQTEHKTEVDTTTLSDSLRMAHEGNEAARKAERDNPANLEKSLGEVSATEHFTQADLDEIKTKLELSDDDPTYKRLSSFASYLGAARQAETNGTNVEIELGTSWDNVRDAVVEGITRDGKLLDKFPELSDITDPNAQKAYIEIVLARDPRLHSEIAKRVNAVLTDVKLKLSDPELDEAEKLKKKEGEYDDVQKQQLGVLKTYLDQWGVEAGDIEQLEKTLDLNDPALALSDTIRYLKHARGISDEDRLGDHISNQSAIDQAEKEASQLRAQKLQEEGKKEKNDDKVATLKASIEALEKKVDDKTRANESIQTAFKTRKVGGNTRTDDDFNAARQAFQAIRELSNSESDLAQNINFITKYRHERDLVKQQREEKESDPDKKAKTEKRAADKELLKKDLQEALAKAAAGFLTKKFNDAASDQKIILTAAQKEAEKNGEKWSADALKTINNILNNGRWSEYHEDTGKWTFDQAQIATDGKMLAARQARSEDGGKELVAGFIGYSLDEATEKNKIAAAQFGGRAYDALSDAEKAQADTLFTKRKTDFDKLYSEQGETIKKRFLTDLFRARGVTDRKILGVGLGGDLILTKEEYGLLNNYFGDMMEKGLKDSKDAQKSLKALQEKGIIPDSKLKWLLYILLALGGAAALGTAGVAGVPLAGMAAGAFGK